MWPEILFQAAPLLFGLISGGKGGDKQKETSTTTRNFGSIIDRWGAEQATMQGATPPEWKFSGKGTLGDLAKGFGDGGPIDVGDAGQRDAWQGHMAEQGYIPPPATGNRALGGRAELFRSMMPGQMTEGTPAGGGIVGEFRNDYLDMLRNAMGEYGASGDMSQGGSWGIPNVHVSPAHAAQAKASLINMLDKAFLERPPADVREDVYSRLKSGAAAGAEAQARKIGDAARLSGIGTNAPWVQSLLARSQRDAARDSTQGLTDFFDQWVQAALGRRAGALSTNAQLQTGVNQSNAALSTSVSQSNAAGRLSASQANSQAGYWRGLLGNQAGQLKQADFNNIMRAMQFLLEDHETGTTSTGERSVDTGGNSLFGGGLKTIQGILDALKEGGVKIPGGGGGTPTFDPAIDFPAGD